MEDQVYLNTAQSAAASTRLPRRLFRISPVGILIALTLSFAGCDLFWSALPFGEKTPVKVMTRNLYVGADIGIVIGSAPGQIPVAVAQFFAAVQATDFPERAQAIAGEIAAAKPDLIGLQEVALYRTQSPGDYVTGRLTPNAAEVAQDFLAILLDELGRRGLDYRVVNEVVNSDIELPATMDGAHFFDVRLTDRDVILARPGVRVTASEAHAYAVNLPLPLKDAQGDPVPLQRGFGSVKAEVRGLPLTFVNTHLETAAAPPVQVAQVTELLQYLGGIQGPVVLVGDFNSAAPGASTDALDTATYGLLAENHADAFAAVRPAEDGFTCCQAADLMNPASQLAWRIDHIWYRSGIEAVLAERVGADPADRTPSGRWPSDHAGVAAVLQIAR